MGSFVEDTGTEIIKVNGAPTLFYKAVIKLGPMSKRVLFFEKESEKDYWIGLLRDC